MFTHTRTLKGLEARGKPFVIELRISCCPHRCSSAGFMGGVRGGVDVTPSLFSRSNLNMLAGMD